MFYSSSKHRSSCRCEIGSKTSTQQRTTFCFWLLGHQHRRVWVKVLKKLVVLTLRYLSRRVNGNIFKLPHKRPEVPSPHRQHKLLHHHHDRGQWGRCLRVSLLFPFPVFRLCYRGRSSISRVSISFFLQHFLFHPASSPHRSLNASLQSPFIIMRIFIYLPCYIYDC